MWTADDLEHYEKRKKLIANIVKLKRPGGGSPLERMQSSFRRHANRLCFTGKIERSKGWDEADGMNHGIYSREKMMLALVFAAFTMLMIATYALVPVLEMSFEQRRSVDLELSSLLAEKCIHTNHIRRVKDYSLAYNFDEWWPIWRILLREA